MNTYQIEKLRKLNPIRAGGIRARMGTYGCVASVLVGLIGVGTGVGQAQEQGADVQGVQVLTRGPVHEAFAGMVTFNPEPGIIVVKAPPEAIEEIPPGERPEGTNITWIPGYWAWDEERSDFLWVSGTWRALPPGRAWMAGYWGKTTDGYQWTSGYWANAASEETRYLPAPPATVEEGPSTKAPSRDYGWTPGNWMWREERYAWSPGYWAQGRADWDWMPAHYMWTPRGYIYVDGYWDYSVERRGMLFAPVHFDTGVYGRPGYNYSPSIVLDLAVLAEHLFLRPNYHHYYFGDYYASNYNQGGYFAAYSYQSSRNGYDPIFSHQRWEHRQDQGWNQQVAATYQYRRDHENARPPRTWDALRQIDATTAASKQNRVMVATSIDQMAKRKNGPMRLQAVAKEDRQMLAARGKEVQQSRDQRRTMEATGVNTTALKQGEAAQAAQVRLPRSPIVGKSASQFKKSQAPPAAQRTPAAAVIDPSRSGTPGRKLKGDQDNPQPDSRRTDVSPRDKQVQPDIRKTEVTPREKQVQQEPREKQVQPQPREKQVQPQPREKQVQPQPHEKQGQPQPREKQVQPQPHEKQVQPQPREKQVQPQPREKQVQPQPREKQVQPQPREKQVQQAPRERQVQPDRSSKGPDQPAKSKSAPSGADDDKSGKKDKKK